MPIGAGKYDELCTYVRENANAESAIVIVLSGERGSGFSVQAPVEDCLNIVELLRKMADEIEHSIVEDLKKAAGHA